MRNERTYKLNFRIGRLTLTAEMKDIYPNPVHCELKLILKGGESSFTFYFPSRVNFERFVKYLKEIDDRFWVKEQELNFPKEEVKDEKEKEEKPNS
jgi:hypothetical protein